jgi:hypothetical protein
MEMSSIYYSLKDGNFVFHHSDGRTIVIGSEVSLLFSLDGRRATLYKHGRPDDVRIAYNKLQVGLRRAGSSRLANNIQLMTVNQEFPLEELNRFLSISGYIGVFMANADILRGEEGKNYTVLREEADGHTA